MSIIYLSASLFTPYNHSFSAYYLLLEIKVYKGMEEPSVIIYFRNISSFISLTRRIPIKKGNERLVQDNVILSPLDKGMSVA